MWKWISKVNWFTQSYRAAWIRWHQVSRGLTSNSTFFQKMPLVECLIWIDSVQAAIICSRKMAISQFYQQVQKIMHVCPFSQKAKVNFGGTHSHLHNAFIFFFNIKIYPVCLVFVVSVIFLNLCVMRAKLLQLCPTLRDPMDQSPPGSSVHGILQHKYWSELPCPPWGAHPDPGIKPVSLTSPALAGRFFTTSTTWEDLCVTDFYFKSELKFILEIYNRNLY